MTTSAPQTRARQRPQRAAPDLYRAVWRWHFYAGLLVLPFLIWLAITGGLYVFKNNIDDFFHARLLTVSAAATPAHAPTQLAAAALAAHPGALIKYTPPAAATRSAEALIATPGGERLAVFIDPYRGEVLGTLPDGGSVAWTIRKLHSLKYFGKVARGAIEIAAGWAILLVLTGIYLWWPRGQKGGVVTVRATPAKRVFWRDLHAVTGLGVGGMLLFLAVTGMPWSVLWGNQINQWANGNNFGYPAGVRVQVPMSALRLADGETT
ncbi:MAG: PepSY domain-containing protein, partial [Comamonas sp.]